MRSKFAVRLQLESPEDRAVPSATASCMVQIAPVAHATVQQQPQFRPQPGESQPVMPPPAQPAKLALSGWLAGQVKVQSTPHVGAPVTSLSGTAELAGLGRVTVEGNLRGVGNLTEGQANGIIKLTKIGDPRSTITLELRGPVQAGFSPLPTKWTATVIEKSGAFAKIQGTTELTLAVTLDVNNPSRGTFHGRIQPGVSLPVAPPLKGWLAGQVQVEQTDPRIADLVPRQFLSGTAKFDGLGRVKVEGFVQGVGFMPQGQATGMLTLTKIGDPNSTITLKLTGPLTRGGSALPTKWTATIIDQSGAFAKYGGSMNLTLSLAYNASNPSRGTFHGWI